PWRGKGFCTKFSRRFGSPQGPNEVGTDFAQFPIRIKFPFEQGEIGVSFCSDGCLPADNHAGELLRISVMTEPWTSVSRKSRPWKR
ncbi:MAG: hypothetical protein ACK56I_27375, partial [bacterium]